jgi:hypothetical protein
MLCHTARLFNLHIAIQTRGREAPASPVSGGGEGGICRPTRKLGSCCRESARLAGKRWRAMNLLGYDPGNRRVVIDWEAITAAHCS